MTLGSYVRHLRKKYGFSLIPFCTAIDVNPSNWSKLERGILNTKIQHETLRKIAEVFNLSTDEFTTLMHLSAISKLSIQERAYIYKFPQRFIELNDTEG